MRGKFSVAMAVMTIGLVAAPVQAAEVLNETCSGNCFTGLDIVNLENASDAAVGVGTVNGATVRFTSTTDLLDLANGAATVSASDGSGFGNLIFELLDGFSFTQADFSLLQATKPISLIFWTNDGPDAAWLWRGRLRHASPRRRERPANPGGIFLRYEPFSRSWR